MAEGLVAQLAGLWADLSRRPLWRRPYTWRYLTLSLGTRLTLLDPRRVRVVGAARKLNVCPECTDNCCLGKASTVSLRLADMAALIDAGRADLMTADKPRFEPEELAGNHALRRTLATRAWAIFPVMRQTLFHACLALDLEGRCTVHDCWPLSCARFPYSLHADDRVVFFSPRCPSWRPVATNEPAQRGAIDRMAEAAVEAYNARIRDLIMLRLVPDEIRRLGLDAYLCRPERW